MKYLMLILLALPYSLQSQTAKQKVIFDCDLGDDIDDAYALGLLLCNQDKFEILGITTCYGRTDDRAILACKILYETGQSHIPVYIGRNTSSKDERANWYADQFYYAKGFKKLKAQSKPAADFILEKLNQYPGEIIVFTVGPVTNMGDILTKDAGALKKAKAVYSMFGSFYMSYNSGPTPEPEWNVRCDVDAAKKFVNCGANIIYAGLDVTAMVKLDKAKRDMIFMRQSNLTNILTGLYTLWGHETPTLFDPVAIGMVLYPALFKTKKLRISVDEKANTNVEENGIPNAEVGVYIKTNDFLSRVMDNYKQQNLEK
ncbi:MAG: nucleoside hydrolase [Saprospiraceae bacterium]